jgi:hypothetical protein
MEALAFLAIWPFLILTGGLVFVSVYSLQGSFIFLAILFLIAVYVGRDTFHKAAVGATEAEQLEASRRAIVVFSISLLLPIFVRYLVDISNNSLAGIIMGLVVGYVALLWGMFIHGNRVLTYSNIIGGGLTLIYIYLQIWDLGELPRIIASAFGLVVAVTIAFMKLREKLS